MNSVNLTGRITADVEVKQAGESSVCNFRIAVKRPKTKDKTDFFTCVAWRNTADFIGRYFKKGSMIAITGCLVCDEYTDKEGNKRSTVSIRVDEADFCESKGSSESKFEPRFETVELDDFPF